VGATVGDAVGLGLAVGDAVGVGLELGNGELVALGALELGVGVHSTAVEQATRLAATAAVTSRRTDRRRPIIPPVSTSAWKLLKRQASSERLVPRGHPERPRGDPTRLGTMDEPLARCPWGIGDPLNRAYHDTEWGVPIHDDRRLFELLNLEGAQAGLAWITILRKRAGYWAAFEGWDPVRIAGYGPDDEARLLADPRIVRNGAKIRAVIGNARAFLGIEDFDRYVWSFVDDSPIQNRWTSLSGVPAETDASRALSRDLKRRGFSFVGPTIVYAFMQSAGLVNDHLVSCFRYAELGAA
jgi:DNA-3-methyladenine glycosylase I